MKKIVLITGASSDIGSEIASLLGDSYEVILHYNNNYDEVMKLKDKLDKLYNTDVLVVKCNLAKEEEIELTDKHFEVLYYLQDQHKKEVALSIRSIGKSGVVDIKQFYELFPKGPLKISSKMAGIPKPKSCI